MESLVLELESARGANAQYDAFVERVKSALRPTADMQLRARRLVGSLALALSGAQLVRHAPSAVSDAFCASRLTDDWGQEYGTLPSHIAFDDILERARPRLSAV